MTNAVPCQVTVLCGFLGAGKTTLLRHLLGQTEGERWALVVNDVGAINLDAKLLSEALRARDPRRGGAEAELVELGNGCVCCSIREDLAENLCRLAASGSYERILIETTGVAEPGEIAGLFTQRNPFGRSVSDFARLQALVTVVDAGAFRQHWEESPAPVKGGVAKALQELLAAQIEAADLLVLNKCDLLDDAALAALEDLLSGLNPRASLVRAEQGQVPREILLDQQRFDPTQTLSSARWIQELNAAAPQVASNASRPQAKRVEPDYTRRYGLRSFLFQARRPFDEHLLRKTLASELPGILRAKGFLWLAQKPDEMAFLTIAGKSWRIDTLQYWWATMVENGRVQLAARPPLIRALWQEPAGDRRQELVFIGNKYDEAQLRRLLESCLL